LVVMPYVARPRLMAPTGSTDCPPAQQQIPSTTSSEAHMASFISEMWAFLRVRKKLWLAPIIVVLVGFGALLIVAQGSVVAPFIYTLF